MSSIIDKARLRELRSAGHWFGAHLSQNIPQVLERGGRAAVEQLLEAAIVEREAALRALGADDEDVAAWVAACRKNFAAKLDGFMRRCAG